MAVVSGYNFQIDLLCPQCGAPAVLEETQTIIKCDFCRTRNILHSHPYPCFYMAPGLKNPAGLSVVYVPYWRFKGLEFSLGEKSPGFRVMDRSHLAVDKIRLPLSIGLRSQTQTLKFIRENLVGKFLPPTISRKEMLQQIAGTGEKKIYIGEIFSLIFMPFFQDADILYDGLSGKKLAITASTLMADTPAPVYRLEYTPSLCPNCGWDLRGDADSLVLQCNHCNTFWVIHHKKLIKVKGMFFDSCPGADLCLPFWRMQIGFKTLECGTYAHLIKLANIPESIQEEHKHQAVYFYVPAFKINPKLFLRIARQTTLAQIEPTRTDKMPTTQFYPATLPLEEGLQAVVPLLMDLCANKKEIWILLAKEKVTLNAFTLVYLPFQTSGSEYVQDTLCFSLPKNSLKFGRRL
ncbi:hypothetical protein [Desulfobacula sp.]|uniref:hypothetical protein n=1 Tax=Desulfobacula sp. TaxID=2593537 RepID=UPI00260A6EA0|nr:hypothetical protein [Desulfobacula sp.]